MPPDEPQAGFQVDGQRAVRAGLRYRPLVETIADTTAWVDRAWSEGHDPIPADAMDPTRERDLLATWDAA